MTFARTFQDNRGKYPAADRARGGRRVDMEHLLIWTYQDQYAHTITADPDRRFVLRLGFGNAQKGFESLAQLGTLVDGSAGDMDIHPDAEAVHMAVLALDDLACGLVIMHAVSGTRPDWMPGAMPRPVPIRRGNGKPMLEYFDQWTRRKPSHCLLRYEPEPELVDLARQTYADWWQGVNGVAVALAARGLDEHQISGFGAPQAPWHRKQGN